MNTALDRYADEPRVMQISGYMFPLTLESDTDAIFLPFTTSWGWATWKRAWNYFDPDAQGIAQLEKNLSLRLKFDLDGSYPYFQMLKAQATKKVDSWAIRWYLTTFLMDALTLHPVQSLVRNTGFDGTGTHCGVSGFFDLESDQFQVSNLPSDLKFNSREMSLITSFLKKSVITPQKSIFGQTLLGTCAKIIACNLEKVRFLLE
jgi:hypothetical protein